MIPIVSHDPNWEKYSQELTPKDIELDYTGYRCTVCNRTIKVPVNAFPTLGMEH